MHLIPLPVIIVPAPRTRRGLGIAGVVQTAPRPPHRGGRAVLGAGSPVLGLDLSGYGRLIHEALIVAAQRRAGLEAAAEEAVATRLGDAGVVGVLGLREVLVGTGAGHDATAARAGVLYVVVRRRWALLGGNPGGGGTRVAVRNT